MFRVSVLRILFAVVSALYAPNVAAVTMPKETKLNLHAATTTMLASRAQSDLQIRRLKTLFAADQLDAESYFDQIRVLQQGNKESSAK